MNQFCVAILFLLAFCVMGLRIIQLQDRWTRVCHLLTMSSREAVEDVFQELIRRIRKNRE
jgi:hypothetical protein